MPKLTHPLRPVVGDKAAKRLATLGSGLRTVGDLLSFYPRRYETRGELTDLAGLRDGEHVTVQAMIASVSTRPMRNRRGSIFEAVVTDGHGKLTLTFFGKGRQDWRERQLAPGLRGLFSGQVSTFRGKRQLSHPEYELIGSGAADSARAGEVGSGKTVVALRAMLQVVDAAGQAALLAPTEVLAQQHHRSISQMLGPLAMAGQLGGAEQATRVALLTGSQGSAVRRRALLEAASGEAGIVIGTHALLEERVQFADLGLIVIDEQHRFGVEQREALRGKAAEGRPHVLVMTATPIPRTVAMTVFGDLEVTELTELPAGRLPIATHVVPAAEKPRYLDRTWERVTEEVAAGRQAYVVCPRIGGEQDGQAPAARGAAARDGQPGHAASTGVAEGGFGFGVADDGGFDFSDAGLADEAEEQRRPALAVADVAAGLRHGALAGVRLAVLHGRLAPDEKDKVMLAFADGQVDVLVTTTVVEVGVDVPNATTMVIMDADRFGVSQLHQLRGRVGRGGHPGLCLLVTEASPDGPARARLDAVAATQDGFALSRLDLEQRREGDVLGAAQAGRRSSLKLLTLLKDEELIGLARQEAEELVGADPALAGQPALAAAIAALLDAERAEFLEKA